MEDPRRSADGDLEEARAALDRGELRHAANHLAGAIARLPTLPETHELLSLLAARTGGALELFPLEPHAFVGTVVARAHLLAAAGRPEDGLPLLAAASGHAPGMDWAGVPWVRDPALGVRMEPGLLARIVMQLCTAIGDPAPDAGRIALRPYLTVVRHAIAAHPQHHLLLGAGSALARRVAEIDLAVDWAERGVRAGPSKLAEIWLGYAYRSADRVAESLAALERAARYDPDDMSVYADIAGTLADAGRLDEALDWMDRALAKDPEFDCAVHTAHRLRFRADGELGHLVALADFVRDHPDVTHEHTDLADCCAGTPWLSGVPDTPPVPPDGRRRPPATTPPSAAAIDRIGRIARTGWAHPPAAYDAALELMLVEPADLLALVAFPPEPARAARVWACLGLLHHGTDEPWMRSTRRRTLVELAVAGADQITEAALFALVTYAWIDPAARTDVAALVTGRLLGLSRPVRTAVAGSVAQLALATPGLRSETTDLAASIVAEDSGASMAEENGHRAPRIPRQRRRRSRQRLLRWLTGPR
ncbi:MAG TPA: tetratricopeptide repeat protein [Actinoplanes sp.]|nr:tetratricopeptide repeat protein [Actinoplanes sp.]